MRRFTQDEVSETMRQMHRRKAQGQDDIPSWLLRDFSAELAPFMAALFNLVLREGVVPHQWTKGLVVLLPKGSHSGKKGFRPVTLLSRVRIAFEKALLSRIQGQLSTCKLQGGFKRNRRTQHWAGILNDILVDSEDYGEDIYVASVDCNKAFDRISFPALLEAFKGSRDYALVRNLTVNQRLRVQGTNSWLYPSRGHHRVES